jgi:hypothetical protein
MTETLRFDFDTYSEPIIYRNRGVVMFDEGEPEPNEKRRRTRVSARIDRTQWSEEIYHPFKAERSPYAPVHKPKSSKAVATPSTSPCAIRYTREQLEAVPMHGLYKMVIVSPIGEGAGWRVKAVCTGPSCDNKRRSFEPGQWLDTTNSMSCPKCWAVARRERLQEDKLRSVKPTLGMYTFYEIRNIDDCDGHYRVEVVGKCTGPRCGGRARIFPFAVWQKGKVGQEGCILCSRAPGQPRAESASLAKLDAAAEEMRALEVAV